MISITILVYSVLVLKVHTQEVSDAEPRFTTESTTPTPSSDWDLINQRNFQSDNSQFNRNNQFQPYLPPQYGPMITPLQGMTYGARLQFENRTNAIPRYFPSYDVPLEAFSVNWTDNDNSFAQPASYMQYPQANGIFSLPGVPYYPSRSMDENRYALIEDPNWQNDNNRGNWTMPPPIIYPENMPRRQARMNSAPAYLENLPYSDLLQRRYTDIRNPERVMPFPPPPLFFASPPGLGSNEDRNLYPEINILGRPPYFDRETGTEPSESATAKSAPQIQPPQALETASAESPIPAETIPRRVVPNRKFPPSRRIPALPPYATEPFPPRFIPPGPFPIEPIPYGVPIPPPELVSPFSFPSGLLPPSTPPPILPNIPLGTNENVLPNILNEPPPAVPQPVASDVAPEAPLLPPPIQNRPLEEIEANPSELNGNIPSVKSSYEFGYEMNDGRGTDQHRKEFSDGSGTVTGSYGYRDAFGVYRLVNYIADKDGFRAFIKSNEPGISNPGSADVRVEAEVPPPKAIEESLRPLRLNPVEIPDHPPLPVVGEKK